MAIYTSVHRREGGGKAINIKINFTNFFIFNFVPFSIDSHSARCALHNPERLQTRRTRDSGDAAAVVVAPVALQVDYLERGDLCPVVCAQSIQTEGPEMNQIFVIRSLIKTPFWPTFDQPGSLMNVYRAPQNNGP